MHRVSSLVTVRVAKNDEAYKNDKGQAFKIVAVKAVCSVCSRDFTSTGAIVHLWRWCRLFVVWAAMSGVPHFFGCLRHLRLMVCKTERNKGRNAFRFGSRTFPRDPDLGRNRDRGYFAGIACCRYFQIIKTEVAFSL